MPTTAKLVNPGHRISERLNNRIDRLWSRRRSVTSGPGRKETKQQLFSRLLEEGLKVIRAEG